MEESVVVCFVMFLAGHCIQQFEHAKQKQQNKHKQKRQNKHILLGIFKMK